MVRVLLTGAGGSASANILDSLRRSGRPYYVVGADVSPVKLHLSAADERCLLPPASDVGYLAALLATVRACGIDVVHAQPDPEVAVVGRWRHQLGARTFLPAQEAIELAADKAAFAARMRQADVSVPESYPFEDLTDVAEVTKAMLASHERVWVRARTGAGARASLPVRSADQAVAWVCWWVEERGLSPRDFMAAEMLPGREFAYQSLWQDGELVAGQARERIEYLYGFLTPSGQSSTPAVARTVAEPAVDLLACQAVRALDPRPNGVYCVDIKEAVDGSPRVTEINTGRFFTTSNFFAAAGLNMPDMAMRAAMGERLERVGSSPLESDLYWIRMVDMGQVLVSGQELDRWQRRT
jgi:carbamoyl-phosphate synthase large subunit